jgi:hypothetical protein
MGPELGRKTGEFQSIRGHPCQHQIPQESGQALKHGPGFAAPLQQRPDGLNHPHGLAAGQGFRQLQQLLLRHGPHQVPYRLRFDRRRQQAELI